MYLPERITYVVSNGKKFDGSYNSQNNRFSGLRKMSHIVGLDTMHDVRNLLLTYDGFKTISISAFDSERNEVVFPGKPLCMGKKLTDSVDNAFVHNSICYANVFAEVLFLQMQVVPILC